MYYFVDIGCIVAEIILIQLFLSSFFRTKKLSKWIPILAYCCFGIALIGLSLWIEASLLRLAFTFVGTTTLALLLYESKTLSAVFGSFVLCVLVALTDTVVMILFSFLNLDTQLLMEYGSARALFLIAGHVAFFACIIGVCVINKNKNNALQTKILLPLTPCWFSSITLCIMLVKQVFETHSDVTVSALAVLLGLLYTNFVVIHFSNKLQEYERAKHDTELSEHHYAMQKEYYEQFRGQQEEVRALWHDISKYLRAMEAQSDPAKLNETLAQVQSMVDSIGSVVDVNNRVVSVILNEYAQAAKDAQTVFEIDVQVPSELAVTAADLYVLLGNTLDNALEACISLPVEKRKISLQLKSHNEILYYSIKNPYKSSVEGKKSNKFHGYGLKNVRRCVERYHGSVEIEDSNGVFCVTAHLNCL